MAVEEHNNGWPPTPTESPHRDEHWTNFDSSVNAVSFGFVATAILISMFLVMAIFERFLRPTSPAAMSPSSRRSHRDLESQKLASHPSPKMSVYSRGVSVLMPGDEIPTYIAHPAPCCPERIQWPSHHQQQQHNTLPCSTSSSSSSNINEV